MSKDQCGSVRRDEFGLPRKESGLARDTGKKIGRRESERVREKGKGGTKATLS